MFREHEGGGATSQRPARGPAGAPVERDRARAARGRDGDRDAPFWVLRPIESGHAYSLGVQTTAVLLAVWVAWRARPSLIGGRVALLVIAALGIAASIVRAIGLDPDAEVVRTYRSLFAALAHGRNPYTCECIVHVTPAGDRLGNFNYPPAEIWPYQAIHAVTGHWNIVVLTITIAALNALAFTLLLLAMPRGRRMRALAFLPLVVLWTATTIAATLVVTAVIVTVVLLDARGRAGLAPAGAVDRIRDRAPHQVRRDPALATWWWWSAVRRSRSEPADSTGGARGAAVADLVVPIGLAVALSIPFGIANVVRSTLL